ncbi:hypothetical protein ACWGKS_26435 [Nocardiopsis sp. NPDC055879]
MDAVDGLMVLPIIGFTPVEEPTSAVMFGGPEAPQVFTPERAANPNTQAVPVVLTRRGEVRAIPTVLPEDVDDVFFTAQAGTGLMPGEIPALAYLGVVNVHEDPCEVFADHVAAAREHRDQVVAARERAALPEPEPVHTVAAQVTAPEPVDVDDVFARAQATTTVTSMEELYALYAEENQ